MKSILRPCVIACVVACAVPAATAAELDLFKGGHLKYLFLLNTFPDDSLFRDVIDTPAVDQLAICALNSADRRKARGFTRITS